MTLRGVRLISHSLVIRTANGEGQNAKIVGNILWFVIASVEDGSQLAH